ncbi:MAG TPA: alpha/beta hydrolase, partial [Patescibacteria group bacterium]
MKKCLSLVLLLLILTGVRCPTQKTTDNVAEVSSVQSETVSFTTSDGLNIAASYFPGPANAQNSVILVHMLAQNRHDWDSLAGKLRQGDFNVLSIDLRGHGQSDGQYQKFDNSDFAKMVFDVAAAVQFLKEKHPETTIKLIGASLGANVALNAAVIDPAVSGLVLLSPGLEYRSVTTEDAIEQYTSALLLVASQDDKASYLAARVLFDLVPESDHYKYLQTYKYAGHGTHMLTAVDDL